MGFEQPPSGEIIGESSAPTPVEVERARDAERENAPAEMLMALKAHFKESHGPLYDCLLKLSPEDAGKIDRALNLSGESLELLKSATPEQEMKVSGFCMEIVQAADAAAAKNAAAHLIETLDA